MPADLVQDLTDGTILPFVTIHLVTVCSIDESYFRFVDVKPDDLSEVHKKGLGIGVTAKFLDGSEVVLYSQAEDWEACVPMLEYLGDMVYGMIDDMKVGSPSVGGDETEDMQASDTIESKDRSGAD
jgi:hypothetical protein